MAVYALKKSMAVPSDGVRCLKTSLRRPNLQTCNRAGKVLIPKVVESATFGSIRHQGCRFLVPNID